MAIDSILSTAYQGIQTASQSASKAASDIASQSVTDTKTDSLDSNTLVSSLVELKQSEIQFTANAKVVSTASDLIGSILDIKA